MCRRDGYERGCRGVMPKTGVALLQGVRIRGGRQEKYAKERVRKKPGSNGYQQIRYQMIQNPQNLQRYHQLHGKESDNCPERELGRGDSISTNNGDYDVEVKVKVNTQRLDYQGVNLS